MSLAVRRGKHAIVQEGVNGRYGEENGLDESRKLMISRGLVGMANSGKRNTNTSQFFFTLDKADELTNKHTMFGKVVGNTIYSESMSRRRVKGTD